MATKGASIRQRCANFAISLLPPLSEGCRRECADRRLLGAGGDLLRQYISGALQQRGEQHRIKLEYIQPGNPQQNAYIER